MVIKQRKAVKAYNALEEIQRRRETTTVRTGKMLFDLKRALQPAVEFQLEREQDAIERNHGVVKEDGAISFPNDDENRTNAKALVAEFEEIANLDTEINIEPFTVSCDEKLHVNMDEIEALEGIVVFE